MSTLKVKPATPDLIVRMPEKQFQPLPAEGGDVENNAYWLRRLHDGDVVLISDAPAKATKNTTAEK